MHINRAHANPTARRTFTLVELLVVMVIMGILMGIALNPFEKMASSGGVDGGTRMIATQLRLARQHAISQRKRVAVLLPDGSNTGLQADMHFSTFRSCEVDSGNVFIDWIPNTKWEFLPTGVVIQEADQDEDATNPRAEGSTMSATTVDLSPWGAGTTEAVRAIIFTPTGALQDAANTYYVTLMEGVATGTGTMVKNVDNQIDLEINGFTGRVKIE